jgi:hypothetical protein
MRFAHNCVNLTSSAIESEIVRALGEKRCTIIELNGVLKMERIQCPDNLAQTLSRLRKKGLIHGEFSEEKSAWVYWADKE